MCSKEPSHRDGSFEYSQHMFWLKNKKSNVHIHTVIWRSELRDYMALPVATTLISVLRTIGSKSFHVKTGLQ